MGPLPQRIRNLLWNLLTPVFAREVLDFFEKKAKSSGPGLDRYTYSDLLSKTPELLLLSSIILLTNNVPARFKSVNTTLIPKKAPSRWTSDFQPISVSSSLSRAFFGILASRITSFSLISPTQRAFMPVDGCANIIILLNSVVHEAKCKRRPLSGVSVRLRPDSPTPHSRCTRTFNTNHPLFV